MSDLYSELTISVRKDSTGEFYLFGVEMSGAFVSFGSRKVGGVDHDIMRAAGFVSTVNDAGEMNWTPPAATPAAAVE